MHNLHSETSRRAESCADYEINSATLCDNCGIRHAVETVRGRMLCSPCVHDESGGCYELPEEEPPGWCGDSEEVN